MTLTRVKKIEPNLYALWVSKKQWLHRKRQSLTNFVVSAGFSPSAFGYSSVVRVRSLTTAVGTKKLYVRVKI